MRSRRLLYIVVLEDDFMLRHSIAHLPAMSKHRRTLSRGSATSNPPRSPSPPTLTYHHPPLLPIHTSALVESVAGGAHYSGAKFDNQSPLKRRRSSQDYGENHRQLKPEHRRVLNDLRELYECRPTVDIFERTWSPDAVFEDPISLCRGYNEYTAHWFAMSKIYSESKILSMRVMSSTHSPNRLVFSLSRQYSYRFLKRKKIIDSIIIVDLDDNDKIIKLVNQWSGKDLPNWRGAHLLRVINARVVPCLIRTPKPS
ncbi:hypothetical protein H2248_009812 [Termitomyces sp. 'cryptogamus']|nr:hypothetical protein H2248_009812 [Termitomyces sp. 'cryptogamus']